MPDIAHVIGSDLAIGPSGDLATVDLADWTQQRILRRLLTNAGGYIWNPSYGSGLQAMVGSPISAQQTAAIIRRQMNLEAAVSATPEPTVTLQSEQTGTVFATVSYTDAQTATPQMLLVPGIG